MIDALRAVFELGGVLESLQIRWLLGGSLASTVYATPRATLDADLLVDLRGEHVKPLIRALGEGWYADEQPIREAIAQRSCFNLIQMSTGIKADCFIPKLRRFDRLQLTRARRMTVGQDAPFEIPVCSPEDIVAIKLEWLKLGGGVSERQWGDILGVLRAGEGKIDLGVIRESAAELGVAELCEKAIREAGA